MSLDLLTADAGTVNSAFEMPLGAPTRNEETLMYDGGFTGYLAQAESHPTTSSERIIQDQVVFDQSFAGDDFSGYEIFDSIFVGADFSNANLSNATITNSMFNIPADYVPAIDGATHEQTPATFKGANLTNAKITESYLVGVDFTGATATNTDFRDSDLPGTDFTVFKDITGANFNGADLRGANFSGIQGLDPKNFSNADVRGANFIGTGITKQDLLAVTATIGNDPEDKNHGDTQFDTPPFIPFEIFNNSENR